MAASGDGVTAHPGAAREAERAPIIYFQRSGSLSPDTRSGEERRKGYDAAAFLSRKAKIDAKYGTRNKGIRRIADRHRQELAEHTQRTQQTYQPLPVAPPVEAKRVYRAGVEQFVHDQRVAERRVVVAERQFCHGCQHWEYTDRHHTEQTDRRVSDRRAAVPAPEPTKADPFAPPIRWSEPGELRQEFQRRWERGHQRDDLLEWVFGEMLRRRVAALPNRSDADWVTLPNPDRPSWDQVRTHAPSLLRALGDTGSGR